MPTETVFPSAVDRCRVNRIQVQGKPILSIDFSQATAAESLAMLEDLPRAFEGQGLNSLRVLTDVTGVFYDSSINQKWKMAFVKFDPYVQASAVYGDSGLVSVAVLSFFELMLWLKTPNAKRKMRVFKDREKALEWLVQV